MGIKKTKSILYSHYKNSPDTLYHGTDTHWNEKGVNIAMELLLKTLQPNLSYQMGYLYK